MKSFIGKFAIASIATLMVVSLVLLSRVSFGEGEGGSALFLFIVGTPLVTFFSILLTSGVLRSVGTAMCCIGFSLLFIPATMGLVVSEFQAAASEELTNSTDTNSALGTMVQFAIDSFAFSAYWAGFVFGGLLIVFGIATLLAPRKHHNETSWKETVEDLRPFDFTN